MPLKETIALASRQAKHSTDSTLTIIGECVPGHFEKTGEAVWRIRGIRQNIDGTTNVTYAKQASGRMGADFDLVWNNRESYSYPA